MTKETMVYLGTTFERTPEGGWLEKGACLPENSTASIRGGAKVFCKAARNMFKGTFYGGIFRGGVFRGGTFEDGIFRGGTFYGGIFRGGIFRGGVFRGGTFEDGVFLDGDFEDGTFYGGTFYGGVFDTPPSCAQRSDGYIFIVKYVGKELRVWAGCRNFSWDEAVSHWNDDHYAGKESQRIIHFLREQEMDKQNKETE